MGNELMEFKKYIKDFYIGETFTIKKLNKEMTKDAFESHSDVIFSRNILASHNLEEELENGFYCFIYSYNADLRVDFEVVEYGDNLEDTIVKVTGLDLI